MAIQRDDVEALMPLLASKGILSRSSTHTYTAACCFTCRVRLAKHRGVTSYSKAAATAIIEVWTMRIVIWR